MKRHHATALAVSLVALAAAAAASVRFLDHRKPESIVRGPGVTEIRMLSEWLPDLAGSPGDTEVYVFRGAAPGSSMLVLGGTHPNEPSSFLSAVLLIENAAVSAGTLYVIQIGRAHV